MSIRNRLARVEAGAVDPLTDTQRFELRRLAAETAVAKNIEALHTMQRELFPDLPTGGHVVHRIENMRDLVAVERSLAEHERAAAYAPGDDLDGWMPAGFQRW